MNAVVLVLSPDPDPTWDCSKDQCYVDSMKALNCDITASRQPEHCILIPRDKGDKVVTYCATSANALTVSSLKTLDPKCPPYGST